MPRITVVVNNRNYGRFLPAAIESALGSGPEVDVVVVDDGSTDGSREIIDRYAGRVRAILQENQGQRGAFNTGLAAATGEVVLFLDADDVLDAGIAVEVAEAFAAHPGASRVVFRLRVVDESGTPTGGYLPPATVGLPAGDLRERLLAFPDDLAWPPTSGNAFAAWALRRVMPMPLDEERAGADLLLHTTIPLLGPVVALDRVGGAYRVHGANAYARERYDVRHSRLLLRQTRRVYPALDRLARELGYGAAQPRSVTIAAHRLVSLRMGGPDHPIPRDTRRRALRAGLRAASGRTDLPPARRAAYALWFVLVAAAPRAVVGRLAETSFQSVRAGAAARGRRPR